MSHEDFERFRELVLRDGALQAELREVTDEETFRALIVRLGAARGYSFTHEDVTIELNAARRAWLERWIR